MKTNIMRIVARTDIEKRLVEDVRLNIAVFVLMLQCISELLHCKSKPFSLSLQIFPQKNEKNLEFL